MKTDVIIANTMASGSHSPGWTTVHHARDMTPVPSGNTARATGSCEPMIRTTAPVVKPSTKGWESRYDMNPARTRPMSAVKTPTMIARSAASLM